MIISDEEALRAIFLLIRRASQGKYTFKETCLLKYPLPQSFRLKKWNSNNRCFLKLLTTKIKAIVMSWMEKQAIIVRTFKLFRSQRKVEPKISNRRERSFWMGLGIQKQVSLLWYVAWARRLRGSMDNKATKKTLKSPLTPKYQKTQIEVDA